MFDKYFFAIDKFYLFVIFQLFFKVWHFHLKKKIVISMRDIVIFLKDNIHFKNSFIIFKNLINKI
jgi:hypothetical protein